MLAVRAKSNGVEIEFTEPLKEGDGWESGDYLIHQWYYLPTEKLWWSKIGFARFKDHFSKCLG